MALPPTAPDPLHLAHAAMVRAALRLHRERRADAPPPTWWLAWAARLGYGAKGIVYLAMGAVAVAVAFGLRDEAAGSRRVLEIAATLPFGRVLAAVLAVGLLGYATLSFVAAVEDPESHGRDLRGLFVRVLDALTGAVYLTLTLVALRLIAIPGAIGDPWGERWLVQLLSTQAGAWLTTLVGVGLVLGGCGLVYKAATQRYAAQLDRRRIGRRARRRVAVLARVGTAARGVAFGFLGLLLAGFADGGPDAGTLLGLGAALGALGRQPAGPALLAVVGLGFVAYGTYQLAKAWFRRMELP